jgi:hypothetical protein
MDADYELDDDPVDLLTMESMDCMTHKMAIGLFGQVEAEKALTSEISNLVDNHCIRPSSYANQADGAKVLPSKYFAKAKFDAVGKFVKLKGRIVACGNFQGPAENLRTSSPTVDYHDVLLMLNLAWIQGQSIGTIDIAGAYLKAELPPQQSKKYFLRLPKYIADVLCKLYPEFKVHRLSNGDIIVEIVKALYGLIQSALLWYEKCSGILKELSFVASSIDGCLFYRHMDDAIEWIVLHVDDMLIGMHDKNALVQLSMDLKQKLGEQSINLIMDKQLSYLGVCIDVRDDGFFLSQPGYVAELLKRFGISKGKVTPSIASLFNLEPDSTMTFTEEQISSFKSATASVLYLAERTRPDIKKEINFLAGFCNCPMNGAWIKLNRVLEYIFATQDKGILIAPFNSRIVTYCDASWASHVNGRSHSGVFVTMGGNSPIMVKSRRQAIVTNSSTEAEIEAMSLAAKVGLPFLKIMHEFKYHLHLPMILCNDNVAATIITTGGEGYAGKSRHMRVRYHGIKELIESLLLIVQQLSNEFLCADLLTKPIGGRMFRLFRAMLLNENITSSITAVDEEQEDELMITYRG